MELDVPWGTAQSEPLAGYDTRVGICPQPSSDPLLILQPRRFSLLSAPDWVLAQSSSVQSGQRSESTEEKTRNAGFICTGTKM